MTTAASKNVTGIDWKGWLERWDRQQEGFMAQRYGDGFITLRETRFAIQFDAVEALAGGEFTAIDLASGPGGISQRLLERFPKATVTAVDLDPVLHAIGRGALGDAGGRLTWVEGDLNGSEWAERLPRTPVDVVLSSTALHWLPAASIRALYRQLAGLIRPGGVFINADHLSYREGSAAARVAGPLQTRVYDDWKAATPAAEGWKEWWEALRGESGLAELFAERDRRFAWRPGTSEQNTGSDVPTVHPDPLDRPGFEGHCAALADAGFAEVDVLWQNFDDRVLLALR